MSERPIGLLLVDEQDLFRDALRALLDREPGMRVIGNAKDGHHAVLEARRLRPDVVVMDAHLPDLSATDVIARIKHGARARSKILVLSSTEDAGLAHTCISAGADGFIGRGSSTAALLDAIRSVDAGGTPLSARAGREIVDLLADPDRRATPVDTRLSSLTSREIEIVGLAGRGLTNHEIGRRLSVSPATAKTHIRNAMKKLRVHDRAQLVVLAHQLDLS